MDQANYETKDIGDGEYVYLEYETFAPKFAVRTPNETRVFDTLEDARKFYDLF